MYAKVFDLVDKVNCVSPYVCFLQSLKRNLINCVYYILKKQTTKILLHPNFNITNDRVRLLLFTISRNSLYHDFLIVKGAGICSLYHEIHYIEIRYIEVWVYQIFYVCTICSLPLQSLKSEAKFFFEEILNTKKAHLLFLFSELYKKRE